ncbi:MAG: hypothetical protein IJ014_02195 [Rikenellaceae bacterium]|nr:hypothetical protein [Rikenellaceae bacterium]
MTTNQRRRRRHLNPKLRPYVYGILVILIVFISYGVVKRKAIEADLEMLQLAKTATIHYQYKYSRIFRDLNDVQLEAAKTIGIEPLVTRDQKPSRRMKLIESCQYYKLDPLTHSIPYLIPEAADLLEDIGRDFADSLQRRFGIEGVCPFVTSVTRTEEDVNKLRRSGNVNASKNSCHFYGTTFDLAYMRFYKHTGITATIESAMMKQMLAEVLKNLRDQGRCYVKYEYKQACFHVTVRE